jgi:hypothetical protein
MNFLNVFCWFLIKMTVNRQTNVTTLGSWSWTMSISNTTQKYVFGHYTNLIASKNYLKVSLNAQYNFSVILYVAKTMVLLSFRRRRQKPVFTMVKNIGLRRASVLRIWTTTRAAGVKFQNKVYLWILMYTYNLILVYFRLPASANSARRPAYSLVCRLVPSSPWLLAIQYVATSYRRTTGCKKNMRGWRLRWHRPDIKEHKKLGLVSFHLIIIKSSIVCYWLH